jgi:YidC/Oxa1 family membrane protein insertase
MIQHGVNPLTSMGGCLLMFAQMPIFLGLYYCLQESIFFRLHGTWIWWIPNLAAPDMLFPWSESIPFISDPGNMGSKGSWLGFLYLGPYFNLLPVVAVALMYLNFKISSPPPTDEQQAMQQRTMKFMMIFMGVFFYKMAAGLCLYFICSTLWGMTERWMLKRKRKKLEEAAATGVIDGPSLNGTPAKPAGSPKPPGFFERMKSGLLEKLEEAQKQAEAQRQIVNNPQQKPPAPPKPPPGQGGQGGQGKRKRRKK